MPRLKKLKSPVTLFAAIEEAQHDALRRIGFDERRSIAEVTRDAIEEYIERHTKRAKASDRRVKARAAG